MSDEEENFDENEEKEDNEKEEKDGDENEEEVKEEEIADNPLTEELVSNCLSLVCKTGDGLAHAFVRLDGKELELTDIQLLSHYVHLRYVDLSTNHLKDISPLSNLTNLLTLKCERNLLTSPQLDPLPYLQSINFNNNKIKSLEGIHHPLLEHLSLNFNDIRSLGGAFGGGLDPNVLIRLHTLELRGNKLDTTEGLYLPNLKNLFLAGNALTRLDGLERLTQLTTLHLRDNPLEKLDGFSPGMQNLQYLNMRGNNISNKKELKKLQCLPMLRAVVLSENPISEEEEYRLEVLVCLRKIIRLDKDEYAEEEREEAEQIYEQRLEEELANEGKEEIGNEEEMDLGKGADDENAELENEDDFKAEE